MRTGIQKPDLKSVEELFAGSARFVVPKYQRNFAWSITDEVKAFWEDLLDATREQSAFFLGIIVLHRKARGITEIIDGQQRLANISMIFSAIHAVASANKSRNAQAIFSAFLGSAEFGGEGDVHPKLEMNKVNNETYEKYVVGGRGIDEISAVLVKERKSLHKSNRDLLEAYKYFLGEIDSKMTSHGTRANEDFLIPLYQSLAKGTTIIEVPVESDEDANMFFESLNARGKELAVSDLVKNRIYLEAGSANIEKAEKSWEAMETELGRRLETSEFLRHYWIAKQANGLVRKRDLYGLIAKEVKGKKAAALTFARDFAKTAFDYAKIIDFEKWDDGESAYDSDFAQTLEELNLFRVSQCYPILLNVIQCFESPKEVAKAFRIVTNFSFRYFVIGEKSPGNLERESSRIAVEIRNGTYKKAADIAAALRDVNSDETFKQSFALVKISQGKIARYALGRINNFLAHEKAKGPPEHVVNPSAKEVNLEHVLPQGKLDSSWKADFSPHADPKDFVHRIGNLTLLTSKSNGEIANKSFAAKKAQALAASGLPLNEVFKTVTQWGDKEIQSRQSQMAKTAVRAWKL